MLCFMPCFFFNDTATTEIYTLSHTTLFRSREQGEDQPRGAHPVPGRGGLHLPDRGAHRGGHRDQERQALAGQPQGAAGLDRKSTRLNSSHANISYAVFCLKKKNRHILYYSL